MARRKRLTPLPSLHLENASGSSVGNPLRVDEKGVLSPRAPIAQIAGDAAAQAAFEEVAGELERARDEGRLILRLARSDIRTDHLIRDRITVDAEAQAELSASLRSRGQQTPIEVVALDPVPDQGPRYGLISGWRRLLALEMLQEETGDLRFADVLALVRRPADQAEAYLAMIEENEIRAGLSFYERARIVYKAVEAGVYTGEKQALQSLFPAISYSKRSKIKSFIPLVAAFDAVLIHPARISERQGLALAKALQETPALRTTLLTELSGAVSSSEENAQDSIIERCLASSAASGPQIGQVVSPEAPRADIRRPALDKPPNEPLNNVPAPLERSLNEGFEAVIQGVSIQRTPHEVVLRGERLTPTFIARLEAWLRAQT